MTTRVDLRELGAEKGVVEPLQTYPSCHAPTICETDQGTLLLAFYAGKREGAPDSVVLGGRFDKIQKKWSRPQVWVHVAGKAVANPRLFQGPDGAIWLLVGVNYGPQWCSGDTYLFLKKSYDDGVTWTDLELFVEQKGLLGKNKPFVDGSLWIIPLEWERAWSATFLRSEDNGKTWQLVGNLGHMAKAHLIQPAVVKLSDGCKRSTSRWKKTSTSRVYPDRHNQHSIYTWWCFRRFRRYNKTKTWEKIHRFWSPNKK